MGNLKNDLNQKIKVTENGPYFTSASESQPDISRGRQRQPSGLFQASQRLIYSNGTFENIFNEII